MASYFEVIMFSLIGGLFSLIGGLILLSRQQFAEKLADYVMPFAAGSLLAAVFLDLLKEGLEDSEASTVLTATLAGIIIFFFAERFLHWFHHHHEHEEQKTDPATSLIIVGDTLHNALDGVAIAAAFLISVPTGIVTTLAVAAHEIPQEIGDFGLLLAKGMKRKRVLFWNVVSSLSTVVLAVVTFALGSSDKLPIGLLLGLSAGFLLYVAMSDIIPTIHKSSKDKRLLNVQPLLLIVGALVVGLAIQLSHQYIDTGHDNEGTAQHEQGQPAIGLSPCCFDNPPEYCHTLNVACPSQSEIEELKQSCIHQKTKEYRAECAPYYHLRQ